MEQRVIHRITCTINYSIKLTLRTLCLKDSKTIIVCSPLIRKKNKTTRTHWENQERQSEKKRKKARKRGTERNR